MKNLAKLSMFVLVLALASCKDNKTTEQTEVSTEVVGDEQNQSDEKVYACPMHPEVTGKQGDECSECGMELTEEVI